MLTGRLAMEQAVQLLPGGYWPDQGRWPLTFEPSGWNSAMRIVLGRVVDHRRGEAVEALRACLDRIRRQ